MKFNDAAVETITYAVVDSCAGSWLHPSLSMSGDQEESGGAFEDLRAHRRWDHHCQRKRFRYVELLFLLQTELPVTAGRSSRYLASSFSGTPSVPGARRCCPSRRVRRICFWHELQFVLREHQLLAS